MHAIQLPALRRPSPRRARAFATTLLALLAGAGCGGDSASGPAAPPLRLTSASAAPLAVVVGIVHGTHLSDATFAGTLDDASVTAARMDDSSFAFVVPAATAAGAHTLHISLGGQSLSATLNVTAPVAVANADAVVASLLDGYGELLSAVDAAYADASRRPPGLDSAAVARVGKALRDSLAQLRADIAAASPEDRMIVARTLAANAGALAFQARAGATLAVRDARDPLGAPRAGIVALPLDFAPADVRLASTVCVAGHPCVTALSVFLDGFAASALTVAGVRVAMELVGTTGGPAGRLLARVAGAGVVGMFLYSKHLELVDHLLVPMIGTVVPDLGDDLRAEAATQLYGLQSPMSAGRPAAINVQVAYRSLTTGDFSQPTGGDDLAQSYATYLSTWNAIASKIPFLSLGAPTLGAQPARTTQQAPPPAQLALTSVTPSPWTGSASASGDLWLVTLNNTRAGQPHDVTLGIRYRPPGLPEQSLSRTVTVQPAAIAASRILLTPATPALSRGSSLRLGAVVQDSAGAAMPDVRLTWTTSRASVARVDTLGTVAGIDTGRTTITVAGAGVQAQVEVHVTAPQYHLYDYGTLGGTSMSLVAVNDSGWIAGDATISTTSGSRRGFFATGPGLRRIESDRIYGMSPLGAVVGEYGPVGFRSFKWKGGTFTALPGRPDLTCPTCESMPGTPVAINDAGTVVGTMNGAPWRAVQWDGAAEPVDLPSAAVGTRGTRASHVNARGDVLGDTDYPYQVAYWRDGVRLLVGETTSINRPIALGNRGQFVIGVDPAGVETESMWFWEEGALTPTPLGWAYHVLDDGRVVGTLKSDPKEVVIWNHGTVTPLATLPATGGYSLSAASERLVLAGVFRGADGLAHAFVMMP